MSPGEIRARCLDSLRALWRTVRRVQQLYPEFPDAPAGTWRAGILAVAERIKRMSEAELVLLAGSYMALRNLVANQMRPERCDDRGCSCGHRVLAVNWE